MSQGISIDNPFSPIVIPADLVKDEVMIIQANFNWGGDYHTW